MQKLCECGCGRPAPIAKETDSRRGVVKGQALRFISGHNIAVQRGQKPNLRHGMWRTPEYQAYTDAKYRCTNPRGSHWEDYGGRGIKFLFISFEQFLTELGQRPSPKHSLDRKNNDGNYEPGNVRWATKSEQECNKRGARHSARNEAL
jgi:hypothetical protein